MARVGLVAAADALGKARKTLQRWRKREGAPFDAAGTVDVDDLRAWATAQGLLDRTQDDGPRTEVERLTVHQGGAPPKPVAAPSASAGRSRSVAPLDDLTDDDRKALEALVAGDAHALIDLAAKVDADLLRRLAAMGKTRQALADADRREIENRKARAEVVAIDDVRRFWAWQRQVVTGAFHGLPGKVSQEITQQPYDVVFGVLERELHELLETLAAEFPS